ncbi:hypothetical protein [Sphingomonas sp.]|uniref:hypothetical protein n=1 Tax=Sphingomonas sp. TaxID=28214 RepID=UPI003CC6C00D
MATRIFDIDAPAPLVTGSLRDRSLALIGPRADALLFWGAPLAAFLLVQLWLRGADLLGMPAVEHHAVAALFAGVSVLTFAHLIAVVPRAYGNREVFAAHRTRLVIVPIVLVGALLASPTLLLLASVVAVAWDVHHSAMQNFGFSRLYDMKAGNPPSMLRATDLRLNWALYVGPLAAGAALTIHLHYFAKLDGTALAALTGVPGVFGAHAAGVRDAAIVAYLAVLGWAGVDYARAMRNGYRLPAHKAATLVTTGAVSILAWGCSPPVVALAVVNIYHAVQYFALVWLKEGQRMRGQGRGGATLWRAALLFGGGCALFGVAYAAAVNVNPRWLLAPFIACSLLHFWYDGFVWSVRKRQV